jgi:hypothetical protein
MNVKADEAELQVFRNAKFVAKSRGALSRL